MSTPSYGLGKAGACHDAVVVMNKRRTGKTSELYHVAKTVVVSPKPVRLQKIDKAWAKLKVPKLN